MVYFLILTELMRFSIKVLCCEVFKFLGKDLMGLGIRSCKSLSLGMHKEPQDNSRTIKSLSLRMPRKASPLSPYVHATGITKLNTSIPQIHNYSTSLSLISPSSYLKKIIKHQASHSIQCTLYEIFITKRSKK